MRTMPYLIKNSSDVWCVQRKVPEPLQAAVARVLGSKKQTQKYLKKSLGTKDRREANRRATHALADLDRTLREAEALTRQQPSKPTAPLCTTLNDAEIKRMGESERSRALRPLASSSQAKRTGFQTPPITVARSCRLYLDEAIHCFLFSRYWSNPCPSHRKTLSAISGPSLRRHRACALRSFSFSSLLQYPLRCLL